MRKVLLCLRAALLAMLLRPALSWAQEIAPILAVPEVGPKLQLTPNSVGAALLVWAEGALGQLRDGSLESLQAINNFPLVLSWLSRLASDAAIQAAMAAALWRLALILAIGLSLEHLARLSLRRPLAALRRHAPAIPGEDVPEEVQGLDDAEQGQTEPVGRHATVMLMLQRIPYIVGALLLDLLPTVLLAAVGAATFALGLSGTLTTRLVIIAVINAYLAWRVVWAVTRMVVSPHAPRLRLVPLDTAAAHHVVRDISQIAAITVGGYAIAEDALLFGLAKPAHDGLLKLVAFAVYFLFARLILRLQRRVKQALRAPDGVKGPLAAIRNTLAGGWHRIVLFYFAALWLIWVFGINDGFERLLRFTMEIVALGVLLRLLDVALLSSFERMLAATKGWDETYPGIEARLTSYHAVGRAVANMGLAIFGTGGVLWATGVDVMAWFGPHTLGERVFAAGGNIVITLAIALAVWEFANIAVERHLARLHRTAQLSRSARLRTLLPMLRTTLLTTVVVVCALVVLSEIGVNIAPLLAGAGVLGLAIGFGSQKLVQDIITGLFLLLENTMQVGDVVSLGGLTGTVENLSIRTIRLRAIDGAVHIVPFSAVTTVTNMTRDYAYAVIDLSIHANEPPDRIAKILEDVAAAMRTETPWRGMILGDLEVMGIDHFLDLGYVLRCRIKTLPTSRPAVAHELHRRIKYRFDELAIESPITSHRALGVETTTHTTIISKTARPLT